MKFLLLFLCLFNSCIDKSTPKLVTETSHHQATNQLAGKESEMTSEEITTIISGLENGDYTILDPFFETNQLFPYVVVTNGDVILLDLKKLDLEEQSGYPLITNSFTLEKSGIIIAYTNQYGIVFLNDNEVVVSKQEWLKISSNNTIGFEERMTNTFNLTDPTLIADEFSQLYDSGVYQFLTYNILKRIASFFRENFKDGSAEKICSLMTALSPHITNDEIDITFDISKKEEFYKYLYSRTFPINNPEKELISLRNYWGFLFFESEYEGLYRLPDVGH
ncbi:MAG: hypothetical protein ACRCTQ_02940 [Brevinemataceae bacterium]